MPPIIHVRGWNYHIGSIRTYVWLMSVGALAKPRNLSTRKNLTWQDTASWGISSLLAIASGQSHTVFFLRKCQSHTVYSLASAFCSGTDRQASHDRCESDGLACVIWRHVARERERTEDWRFFTVCLCAQPQVHARVWDATRIWASW
jgi:hypothetical protein